MTYLCDKDTIIVPSNTLYNIHKLWKTALDRSIVVHIKFLIELLSHVFDVPLEMNCSVCLTM